MDLLHPFDSERGIIGILSNAHNLGEASGLSPGDFNDRENQDIFAALQQIAARREPLALPTIDEQLTRNHGQDRAAQLMDIVMTAQTGYTLQKFMLGKFVAQVREASQRRQLQKIAQAIARGAEDEQRDVAELMDSARTALIRQSHTRGGWVSASDACVAAYEAAETAQKPIPTGIFELDAILCGGMHRGEFTVLGARPAVGKSAVLLHIARNAAAHGFRTAFVSLEMSSQQIGARLMASESGVNAGMLRSGKELPDRAWTDLADALVSVGDKCGDHLSLLARGALTVEELRDELQSMFDGFGCDLLVVDYLQLLRTRQKTGSDFERLGIVSRALKAITLDFGIPVIAAAQVRRQNNGGILRAPGMDELRGSGDIEQDADNVLLLHRPETPDDSTLHSQSYVSRHSGLFEHALAKGYQLLTVDVAKQRQGITARAWCVFNPSRMRFVAIERETCPA